MTKVDWVAVFAAVNLLLLVLLTFQVVGARRKHKVVLGDGGNAEVLQAMRTHGNAAETMPLALFGLGLLAFIDPIPLVSVIGLGAAFTLSRLLHAVGLSGSAGPSFGRVSGTVLSVFSMIGIAAALLYGGLSPLL